MIRLMLILMLSLSALAASAQTARVESEIARTLAHEGPQFGGCMVLLNVELRRETGVDCKTKWVTFSCTGDFVNKDAAMRLFDSAKMAFALNKKVMITVDDTRKHNGFCFGQRIEVLQ